MSRWSVMSGACVGASLASLVACTGDVPPGASAPSPDAAISDDGSSAGTDARSEAAALDAGPDAEQDPNVYPAVHQPIAQVDNLGGPVLDHAKLVTVTFRGDAMRDAFRAYTHELLTSVWWRSTLGTFGLADGANGGDFELADTVSGRTITDADFQEYARQQIALGSLPIPDSETLFMFYVPQSTTLDTQGQLTCKDNGGYHGSFLMSLGGADAGVGDGGVATTVDVAYAIIPRCYGSFQDATIAASHEIAEAATEPTPADSPTYYLVSNDAWIPLAQGRALGGEVGDLCSFLNYDESGYTVQRIWSNAAAAASKNPCQPAKSPYFGAAVRTTPRIVSGTKVNGHVAVPRGQSVVARVDVFSESALSHELSLEVGVPTDFGFDSLPQGVQATLSRATAHNGNAVVMTLSATSAATPGSIRIAVRSTLDANDFNDWPVILTVK